mmetsp:Transcript_30408/g.74011  ORF Transcript_30408/g.74011 Transcript_30408/m.74011 type:complete len:237 (-) Transcript_30408:88-798(-)
MRCRLPRYLDRPATGGDYSHRSHRVVEGWNRGASAVGSSLNESADFLLLDRGVVWEGESVRAKRINELGDAHPRLNPDPSGSFVYGDQLVEIGEIDHSRLAKCDPVGRDPRPDWPELDLLFVAVAHQGLELLHTGRLVQRAGDVMRIGPISDLHLPSLCDTDASFRHCYRHAYRRRSRSRSDEQPPVAIKRNSSDAGCSCGSPAHRPHQYRLRRPHWLAGNGVGGGGAVNGRTDRS